MKYTVTQKSCEKDSNEKVVQFPTKILMEKYVENGGHEPYRLTAILTCPKYEHYMNFVSSTGDKTNQVT